MSLGELSRQGSCYNEQKMCTTKISYIPPVKQQLEAKAPVPPAKKKVAAYIRISTNTPEQQTSLINQMAYFRKLIRSWPEWELVDIYTDIGISALETKKREGFQRMITDAMNGKINLIVTKSVSRFARNTVDSLKTIRQLKEQGVDVYFEKENIHTMDSDGELLITIMSSIAQEESRSISENTAWGKRHRMAEGKVVISYGNFLGYRKGKNGEPEIVESEAKTVRKIYQMFLDGHTIPEIASKLTGEGILTPTGKNHRWNTATIRHILMNEKYAGDALLQKAYITGFPDRKRQPNKGYLTSYYVTNSHPAIISRETFGKVQSELQRRKGWGRGRHSASPYDRKIVCGDCGKFCGRKLWHVSRTGRNYAWCCTNRYRVGSPCQTSAILERTLDKAFERALKRRHESIKGEEAFKILDRVIIQKNGDALFLFRDGRKATIHARGCKA